MKIEVIIPALCTPTDEKGDINVEALHMLLDYVINAGVHGVFVLGSSGEFYALDKKNRELLMRETISYVNKRCPVMIGASGNSTREVIEEVKMASNSGADCVSVLTPYFIVPNQYELEKYYCEISNSTTLPLSIYNNPGRTKVNVSPAVLRNIIKNTNIVGIKDSSGDFSQMLDFIEISKEHSNFSVLSGRDNLLFANLVHGGHGGVVAVGNVIPKIMVEIYNEVKSKNYENALELQFSILEYRNSFCLGNFPAVVKQSLSMIGIDAGLPLSPVQPLSDKALNEVKEILSKLI